jgi:Domain of unknown function (DUF2610)
MKRLTIPCDFNGVTAPFHVYIGNPSAFVHPLHFQNAWLREARGGRIAQEVLDSFERLADIARKEGMSYEDVCVYALGLASGNPSEDAR